MSTLPSETASSTDEPLASLLFDYPDADIILRSQDSHRLRVPQIFLIHNSIVLNKLVRGTLDSPGDANVEASLPVIQLPESGKILRYLLTFILPISPAIPPTHEETMELLSVAQKYEMETVLVHIRAFRGSIDIARQNPPPTHLEPALHLYALAQNYGLRPEALQFARTILKYSMTIEDLGDKLDDMPGAFLYELWTYYERVRTILALDLTEFRSRDMLKSLRCKEFGSSLSWVDQYIVSVGNTPNLYDPLELNIAMIRHIKNRGNQGCECGSITSQTMHEIWNALVAVVGGSFEKAESALSLVQKRVDAPVQINSASSPPDNFDVPYANLIIRSSDLVDFRVHKHVLAMTSPVFKDLFSLPQPPDGKFIDGLPMVQLSEDSDILGTLVSMLYPLPPVIPKSYEKVLYLLVTCQKYEMAAVQSRIRAEVGRGEFPAPKGTEAFSAYAIASSKLLVLEVENTALQTLDHPMTFEVLGEGLRLFEGWALRDLVSFRKRCRDNLVLCFKSLLNSEESQTNVWPPCASYRQSYSYSQNLYSLSNISNYESLPSWRSELYQKHLNELQEAFSKSLSNPRSIRGEYLSALQAHVDAHNCVSCTKVHMENGETFCKGLEDKLTQALNEALSDLISQE